MPLALDWTSAGGYELPVATLPLAWPPWDAQCRALGRLFFGFPSAPVAIKKIKLWGQKQARPGLDKRRRPYTQAMRKIVCVGPPLTPSKPKTLRPFQVIAPKPKAVKTLRDRVQAGRLHGELLRELESLSRLPKNWVLIRELRLDHAEKL